MFKCFCVKFECDLWYQGVWDSFDAIFSVLCIYAARLLTGTYLVSECLTKSVRTLDYTESECLIRCTCTLLPNVVLFGTIFLFPTQF